MANKKVKIAKKGYSPKALSEKFKKLSKSMKAFVMIAVLLAVGGGYYGYNIWQENQDSAKAYNWTSVSKVTGKYYNGMDAFACKVNASATGNSWYIRAYIRNSLNDTLDGAFGVSNAAVSSSGKVLNFLGVGPYKTSSTQTMIASKDWKTVNVSIRKRSYGVTNAYPYFDISKIGAC